MRLAIFGSTGLLGRRLVEKALAEEHMVTAFVREPESLKLSHKNLCIAQGDIEDGEAVYNVLKDQDAVLNALGDKVSGEHTTFRQDSMRQILAAMQLRNIKRIITVGGMGVLQENAHHLICENPHFPKQFKHVSDDHLKTYELLKQSETTWTMVCPPQIKDGMYTGDYRVKAIYHPGGNQVISSDLADFMVNELVKCAFVKTRVGIGS